MKIKKRYITFKTKIMISMLVSVIISYILISSLIFISSFNLINKAARAEFSQINEKYAHSFETKINSAMNYLSVLSSELESQVQNGPDDRATLQKKVLKLFDDYELIDGSSVYFEPNMYDGQDSFYLDSDYGTPKSGRICWYFYKDNGETAYLREGVDEGNDMEFDQPHYTNAKEKNIPISTDPALYEIDGKMIAMFTLTYPIHDSNSVFIGAVTVDLFLDDIYTQLQNEKIYETGYVVITNSNHQVIYCPHYDDIGSTQKEANINYSALSGGGESDFFSTKSKINGKDSLAIISSVYIPQLYNHFYISVTAPLVEIYAEGIRLIIFLAAIIIILIVVLTLLLNYMIGIFSAPLNEIMESANKIASGEYSARIKGAYKSEFAIVKDSVNIMADSIEAHIKESENSLSILQNILNGLDAFIYVTDPETDIILFMNDSMKKHFGVGNDAVGRYCYDVLQADIHERCEFCPCTTLDKEFDKTIVWEKKNTVTQRDYRNTDCYIEWLGGIKVHLQHSVDITEIKFKDTLLKTVNNVAEILLQSEIENFDNDLWKCMGMVADFIGADRAYIFKNYMVNEKLHYMQLYEWSEDAGRLQSADPVINVPYSAMGDWEEKLSQGMIINDLVRNLSPAEQVVLSAQGTLSILAVPVFLEDQFWGFIGFDNCQNERLYSDDEEAMLRSASLLITNSLLRNEMALNIRAAVKEAQTANAAKSDFLANMSHEIRTPMNSIIGFSELALDDKIPPKTRGYLTKIRKNSELLLQIINDVLDISKIESGRMELEHIPFDIHELLASCQNIIMPKANDRNLLMHFYAEPAIGKIPLGDPTRLLQVLLNLLTNAVKFTHTGVIKLQAVIKDMGEKNVTILFEIEDSGIGMTPEQIQRIFEPFIQAESGTTRKYGGTGLGLAITKNIVELMGGKLDVESKPNVGSKFSFALTFDTMEASEGNSLELKKAPNEMKKPTFEGEILVCEDNSMNQQVISEHLARVGVKAVIAENGKVGVDMVSGRMQKGEKQFDLIFMDLHMPVMDGLDATKRIREFDVNIPIVAMTANIISGSRDTAISEYGMNDYMGKPFTTQELWHCLTKYLKIVGYQESNASESEQEDSDLRKKLISNFVKNNQRKYDEISEAINIGDIKLAHRLTHTLKGNAGQLEERLLQQAAETVENRLKNGENQVTPEQMSALKTELTAVLRELVPLAQEEALKPLGKTAAEPLDAIAALELIQKLEPLLENGNPECLKYIDSLRTIQGSEDLINRMEDFDFELSMVALVELKKLLTT